MKKTVPHTVSRNKDLEALFSARENSFQNNLNKLSDAELREKTLLYQSSQEIDTRFGKAVSFLFIEEGTGEWTFISSGKVFNELFETNVEQGNAIRLFRNEKRHWRFSFVD